MAIKIGGNTAIDNNRKGVFARVNFGSYTQAQLRSGSYNGSAVGDITYCSDLGSLGTIVTWDGSEWSGVAITASGGFVSTPGNGYKYHVFTASGAFAVTQGEVAAEYLVVASGGGGSSRHGGGGGAGGGLHNIPGVPGSGSAMTCAPGTYPVTVATSGGNPVSGPSSNDGYAGSDSIFAGPSTITADGGGAGTKTNNNCPRNVGGCGGSSHDGSCPRSGTQGGDGGISGDASPGGNTSGGPGGNGKSYGTGFSGPLIGAIMTANSVPSPEVSAFQTAVGPTGLYAGGGGGGQWGDGGGPAGAGGGGMGGNGSPSIGPGTNGAAGPGGGGIGGVSPSARAAAPGVKFTGGGGGGGGGTAASGSGGAGIVVIRYAV